MFQQLWTELTNKSLPKKSVSFGALYILLLGNCYHYQILWKNELTHCLISHIPTNRHPERLITIGTYIQIRIVTPWCTLFKYDYDLISTLTKLAKSTFFSAIETQYGSCNNSLGVGLFCWSLIRLKSINKTSLRWTTRIL